MSMTGHWAYSGWTAPSTGPCTIPTITGFIPATVAEDGDPMDVLTLVDQPSFPGCLIEVRPAAVLNMVDSNVGDQKIIAVPTRNPRYDQIHTIDQIFPHIRREVEHFFSIYKELEGASPKCKAGATLAQREK